MKRLILISLLFILSTSMIYAQDSTRYTITSFTTTTSFVNEDELIAGTVRIPLSWKVTNRNITMNLVFEQVMPDGSLINVELPRQNVWVNSNESGVAVPQYAEGITEIHLQVRLYAFLNGRTLDTANISIPILDSTAASRPRITSFSTTTTQIAQSALNNGTARIPVTWEIINRPANSNLYFEQILTNNRIVNVELPRQNPYVSSSGAGIVAPLAPDSPVRGREVTLQISLRDMTTGDDYDSRMIFVPIDRTSAPAISINRFDVSSHTITEGEAITITWDVTGVNNVTVTLTNYYGQPRHGTTPIYANQDTVTLTTPTGVKRFNVLLSASPDLSQAITIEVDCLIAWEHDITDTQLCPDTVKTATATYQPFERGFVLAVPDVGIWIHNPPSFYDRPYTYAQNFAETSVEETPPEGLQPAVGRFSKIWSAAWYRDLLGWATAPESTYTIRYQLASLTQKPVWFSLPDGTIITLPQ